MRIEAYRCDMCGGERVDEPTIVIVATGERSMDAAGSMVDESRALDTCPACVNRALREYAKAHPEKWREKA